MAAEQDSDRVLADKKWNYFSYERNHGKSEKTVEMRRNGEKKGEKDRRTLEKTKE